MNFPSTMSSAPRWSNALILLLAGLLPAVAMAQGSGFTSMSEVRPAPVLVLADMDDKRVDLADLRGRVVIVNFWATWCPPCRREFPSLERLQKLFPPEELKVIAVNVGEDIDSVFSFAGNPGIIVLLDRETKAMANWPVKGLPSTFVIDPDGRLVLRAIGGREFDDPSILTQLKPLIERKTP